MTTITERLKWLVEADAHSAIKAFEETGAAAEAGLGKAQSKSQKLGGTLTKTGAGAVAFAGIAGVALFEVSKKWEEAALAAGKLATATGLTVEQASAWQVVAKGADVDTATLTSALGKMDKAIEKTPQKFADLGATIVHTKNGAIDTSATFLNVVDALHKAGGAANNANTATAILGKGWQGMAEIIGKSSDELKARLEGVNKAQIFDEAGVKKAEQFRDTMKSLGNAAQGLAISIGSSAAPVIADFAGGLAHVVGAMQKADDATGGMVGKFTALGTIGVGTLGTLSLITGQVIKMSDRFHEVGVTGVTQLSKAGAAAVTLGTALGIAAIALTAYSLQQKLNADNNKAMLKGLDQVTKGVDAQAEAIVLGLVDAWQRFNDLSPQDAVAKLAAANLDATVRTRDLAAADSEYAAKLESHGITVNMLTSAINHQVAVQKQEKDQADQSAAATKNLTDSTEQLTTVTDKQANATEGSRVALGAAKGATTAIKDATDEATKKSDAFAKSLQGQIDKLDALYPKEYDAVKAKYDYQDSAAAAMKAVGDLNTTLGDHKSKQEDVAAATLTARDAIISASEKYAGMDGAASGSEGSIRRQIKSLQDQAANLAPDSPLRQFLDQYISDLQNIPSNISTIMDLHISSDATNVNAPGYGQRKPGQKFAEGGYVPATPGGAQVTVAEAGQGEYMIPEDKMGNLGGGQTINYITINPPVGSDFNQWMRDAQKWAKRNGTQPFQKLTGN